MGTPKQIWTRALTPGTPVAEAAAITLDHRLANVIRLLSRAAHRRPGTPEAAKDVHGLRVATRRAAAALDVFRACLSPADTKRITKRLRAIRRAAGEARDLDVQLKIFERAASTASGPAKSALQRLARSTSQQRQDAHKPLASVSRNWPTGKLRKHWEKALKRLHPSDDRTLADAARDAVARAVDRVEQSAAADLRVIDNVHILRLKLKRLRYAMEAVGVCFGDVWKKRVEPRLVSAQDLLGEINDSHVLINRLAPASPASAAKSGRKVPGTLGLESLVRDQCEALARSHAAFLEQWGALAASGFLAQLRHELGVKRTAVAGADAPSPPAPGVPTTPTRILRPFGMIEHKPGALNGTHPPSDKGRRAPATRRRIAAIDVGTNSVRLIVAEAQPDGSYRILDDEKEITRLGRALNATGKLDAPSIEHTIVTIARMQSIAQGYGAAEIQVVGTAAAREAKNASVLEKQLKSRTGLDLKVISGEEEAMLAYRSAANAFDLAGAPGAVVDIGGGSTEIVLSAPVGAALAGSEVRRAGLGGGLIERVYTIPIGAVRLTDRFGGPEHCSGKRYEEMRAFIKQTLKEHVGRPPLIPQIIVGTGGTLTTLASMVLQKELGPSGDSLFSGGVQGLEVSRADLKHLLEYLRKLPVKERTRVPGLSSDRADIIIAGLAIVDGVLKRFGANRVRVHEGGIRDGILLSMVGPARDGSDGAVNPAKRDPMKAVRRFAKSCAYEAAHAKQVTTLALQIFDQLATQHARIHAESGVDFGSEQRLILEAAALLHDIGYLINYAQHHKHSYHLIVHADLPGLTTRQVQVIANIARYHRAAEPKIRHRAFALLSDQDRAIVRSLSGILRIADGLDRTHMQSVRSVGVRVDRNDAFFSVSSEREPAVDTWGAVRKSSLFKEAFGLVPHFEWVPILAPAPASPMVTTRGSGVLV